MEQETYRDLSPTKEAAEVFVDKLPDRWNMSGEIWRIFHFGTEDASLVRRTIQLACREVQKEPVFLSLNDFYKWVRGREEIYNFSDKKKGKSVEKAGFDFSNLDSCDGNTENKLFFVDMSMDSDAMADTGRKTYYRLIFEYMQYCEMKQNEQLSAQITYKKSFLQIYWGSQPVHNQIFFFDYGNEVTFPDVFRKYMTVIPYKDLTAEDFGILLQEFTMRDAIFYNEQRKKHKLPELELRALDVDKISETLAWYANHMAGMQESMVRRMLCDMRNLFYSGHVDYTEINKVEPYIRKYKNSILQNGRLEMIELEKDSVYGMDQVSNWLNKHKELMHMLEDAPTGILLVGIPGTGKSATAHMAANKFRLPLARLDISNVLGGHVGDSEKGMREVLEDLKFAAPCILWIDEIEKAMSGADGKSGDSGVMQRLFGMLLTFIQENKKTVFIVATANDISKLPPEFFRNGRFDQTFCVMMPDYIGCATIMQKKLEKYGKKLGWKKEFELVDGKKLFNVCTGTKEYPRFLTGADIESHVKELFWMYKTKGISVCPDMDKLELDMKGIAEKMRVQASPDSANTMQDIAVRYLDMMQRGMQMAGSADTPFQKEKLDLDAVRYYKFDKEHPMGLSSCMGVSPYENYKEEEHSPEDWYDKVFYDELVKAMNEAIIFDKDMTLETVRMEYLEWKRYEILEKRNNA